MTNTGLLLRLGLLLAAVHIVNVALGGYLVRFGIFPRDPSSLPFILTAPFLHGDWLHLGNNLFGLAVFGTLTLLHGQAYFFKCSALIIVLGGLLLWAVGRPSPHIGASLWIFGLWSLTIASAWFSRSFLSLVIALAVLFFYGGMVWGLLPSDPLVSFEGHASGAVAGIVAAGTWARETRRTTALEQTNDG